MFCLLSKFILFANQTSYLDLRSYILHIIWQGVHLLVKLKDGGTNKNTKIKSLTGIFQGFGKCTKATLQNDYFWGTLPDDCFCIETYLDIIMIKSAENLKLFSYEEVAGRWIEINLLILYYLWKKLPKFSMLFLFNLFRSKFELFFLFHFEN